MRELHSLSADLGKGKINYQLNLQGLALSMADRIKGDIATLYSGEDGLRTLLSELSPCKVDDPFVYTLMKSLQGSINKLGEFLGRDHAGRWSVKEIEVAVEKMFAVAAGSLVAKAKIEIDNYWLGEI